MNDLNKQWYTLNVLIEAAAREPIEYGLMEAGALGTEADEYAHAPDHRGVGAAADLDLIGDLPGEGCGLW